MMYDCNYCVELNVSSGYMCFSDLSYRFSIVIDIFSIKIFRSRPAFPFLTKKYKKREWFRDFPDCFHP